MPPDDPPPPVNKSVPASPLDDPSVDLSSRRTGMSFQRTRLSADRTLMSVIRTSLSLISFGFTIYQFFERLVQSNTIARGAGEARRFGLSLVLLGLVMLLVGIGYDLAFMSELRALRAKMAEEGLIHAETRFPRSYTLVVAFLLLAIGILAVMSLAFHVGPFG